MNEMIAEAIAYHMPYDHVLPDSCARQLKDINNVLKTVGLPRVKRTPENWYTSFVSVSVNAKEAVSK
jgi:hypothetical protein